MRLPLVFSLPHSSARVPRDIADRLALGPVEVEESVDLGASEVFAQIECLAVVPAAYSRLVVDLNRAPDDMGEKGAVPATDYAGRRVYRSGLWPDDEAKAGLVRSYWQPYHQALERQLAAPGVEMLIDCHSLDGLGPPEAPDPGARRADITLGNRGGPDGEAKAGQEDTTCPGRVARLAAACLEGEGFSVALNQPYGGGHLVRTWAKATRWGALQIELNKDLYADSAYSRVYADKAEGVRERITRALERFARRL